MPSVTIGIASYNGAQRLDWLLRSLAMRTPRSLDFQVVVVDDGSPRVDETRQVMRRWTGELPLLYVEHGTNRGISAGWNTASRAIDSEIAVLLNDDVILPSGDWLGAMLFALRENPKVGGVGLNWHAFLPEDVPNLLAGEHSDVGAIPRDPGSKQLTPERRSYEEHGPGRVMCPTGQCFAFRREDFDAIGGFDEQMLSFHEESSFGTAMAANRKKIGMQLNWPQVWHLWSATFAQNPELRAHERMVASRRRYIDVWQVPPMFQGHSPNPSIFDYTNPKHMEPIGDVPVRYRKKDGSIGETVLVQPEANEHWKKYVLAGGR